MGFIEFLILCIVVIGLAWVAVWAIGHFFPGHPVAVDYLIWGVAILIIVYRLLQALGLVHYDPQIPRVG